MLSTLFLLAHCFALQAQTDPTASNTARHNEFNIYYQALVHIVDYDSHHYKLSDTIFVEGNFYISTDSLLASNGHYKFMVLDQPALKKQLINGGGITLYRLFPLSYSNDTFSVSCVPFSVSYRKKYRWLKKIDYFNYENGGTFKVIFKLENKEFKFIKVESYWL